MEDPRGRPGLSGTLQTLNQQIQGDRQKLEDARAEVERLREENLVLSGRLERRDHTIGRRDRTITHLESEIDELKQEVGRIFPSDFCSRALHHYSCVLQMIRVEVVTLTMIRTSACDKRSRGGSPLLPLPQPVLKAVKIV